MKTALCLIAAMLSGCTSTTVFGPCVGMFDDKDPALVYKLSAWNIGVGIVFAEMIIPPIVVIADETFCPVSRK